MTVVWVIGDAVQEFDPKDELVERYQGIHDQIADLYELQDEEIQAGEFEDLALEACGEFIWVAKDIRNSILGLIDTETTEDSSSPLVKQLQASFDQFNGYVRDAMKDEKAEDDALKLAMSTYEDDAVTDPYGAVAESISPALRKKSATIVRTKPDGTKEHKFPIPDKAHAKAALMFINRSDLTPAEKAKVRRKAHATLQTKSKKGQTSLMDEADQITKEANPDMIDDMEAELQVLDLSEATVSLDKGELEVTFLKPGFNKSGYRYYTKEAIQEAVDNGMFNNLKMFMNHQTPQEMQQRPERSVTDWVSTMKETWVDSNGAAKGKVKVVQSWFSSFLKDLQESGAIGEIGLSIFASGKVKPTRIDNRQTNVVERFQRAMSVDWVTEPGAGGRVDQMWESYQPVMHKEQELNVLASMDAGEAIKTLKESRPDVLEEIAKQLKEESDAEGRLTEATAAVQGLMDKVAQLEAERVEAEKALNVSRDAAAKDKQLAFVVESLSKTELPQIAKDRIKAAIMLELHKTEEGEFDQPKVEGALKESVDSEVAYIGSLVKESGGKGIQGLGSTSTASQEITSDSATDIKERLTARLNREMGNEPITAA